jgi:hypothetical protein
MTSKPEQPSSAENPKPTPEKKLVRFDFQPGTSAKEIVKQLKELAKRHRKT